MGKDDCEGGEGEAGMWGSGEVEVIIVCVWRHDAWLRVLWGAAVECIFVGVDETGPTSSSKKFLLCFVSRFLCFVSCDVHISQNGNISDNILVSDNSSENISEEFVVFMDNNSEESEK